MVTSAFQSGDVPAAAEPPTTATTDEIRAIPNTAAILQSMELREGEANNLKRATQSIADHMPSVLEESKPPSVLHSADPVIQSPIPQPDPPPTVTVKIINRFRFTKFFKGQIQSPEYWSDMPAPYNNASTKKELVEHFFTVPYELEKLMGFGFAICLDSLLYIFTILPVRICMALFARQRKLSASQKCDLMKGLLIVICCFFMEHIDGSRIYHSVRGQSHIKLYVLYNMLEIGNSLLSSLGHDILDSLFQGTSEAPIQVLSVRRINRVTHFGLALIYLFCHSLLLFYHVIALNIAFNSKSNTLFSLILGNQFYEIKAFVFKKYDREFLFQLSCGDIVERFQLSIFLVIICLRNYIEFTAANTHSIVQFFSVAVPNAATATLAIVSALISNAYSAFQSDQSLLASLSSLPAQLFADASQFAPDSETINLINIILTPAIYILATEFLIDWIKHGFMTKFNNMKPHAVYKKYRQTLARDLMADAHGVYNPNHANPAGRSTTVARRIGLVTLPVACLVVRVFRESGKMLCVHEESGGICARMPWNLDWNLPRGYYAVMGGVGACVRGVSMQLDDEFMFSDVGKCFERVGVSFFADTEAVQWGWDRIGAVAQCFALFATGYVILFTIKVMIGFSLIRYGARKCAHWTSSSAAEATTVPTTASATASTAPAPTVPSTPTKFRAGRRPSSPLVIDAGYVVYPAKPKDAAKGNGSKSEAFTNRGPLKSNGNVEILFVQKDEKLDGLERFDMIKRIV